MRKTFTYADLGNPTAPGIQISKDGSRVNLDATSFDSWRSMEFRSSIRADLIHPVEHIGGAIYTVTMIGP